ncbi:hypothetical protein [Rheinheimera baltica]|uniref:hypothetical protein n=1 Tax=Rheinheimera baltica TaxID=67576 RepID=UPI00041C2A94|nr:hypothetical protein [Rheinheimera baltica]
MRTTPVKPLQQLQQHAVVANQQHSNQQSPLRHGLGQQAFQQEAYLRNINFMAYPVVGYVVGQAKPDSQLFSYQQFIRVCIGMHVVVAVIEQISDAASLTPFGVPNNVYFWSDVKVGCFQ